MEPQRQSLVAYRDGNDYWMQSVLSRSVAEPQRLQWAASMLEDFNTMTLEEIRRLAAEYCDLSQAMWVIGTVVPQATTSERATDKGSSK